MANDRFGWVVAAAALLLLAACGDGAASETVAEQTTTTVQQTTTVAQQTAEPDTTEASTETTEAPPECEEPATEIPVGVTNSEIVGRDELPGEVLYFCVEIPDGVSSIEFSLTGMTAGLDLFVGYPNLETVQEGGFTFWFSDERGTDDKVLVVGPGLADFVNAGSYYIEVSGQDYRESSPFVLTVDTQ